MLGYPQSKQQWETVGTHCCISHSEEIKYIADNRVFFFFFNCYLAAPWPNLGHYRGDSLTHPMLITVFYIFDPKVTGSLIARLGS